MAGQVDESSSGLERTDELPVLSDEAIRRFERASHEQAGGAVDELDASIDTLRSALERAETRWRQLETRLEAQDRAIDELRSALGKPAAAPVPELTDIVRILPAPVEPSPAAEAADANGRAVRTARERIADLEAYIAGRSDHWRAMEAEVEEKARRIAELEKELEQRIAREENLKQQLHQECGRSESLRDRLQRANLRLDMLRRDEIDLTD